VSEQSYGPWEQSARLAFKFIAIVVLALAGAWLVSNIRQIPSDSRAVVVRFGQIVQEQGPGLLLAWPRPIDEVVIVPALDSQLALPIERYEQPYGPPNDSSGDSQSESVASNSLMFSGFAIDPNERANGAFLVTGDFNVVHIDATLFYQIVNPRGYVMSGSFLKSALTRLYNASAISIAASRELDAVLVARPEAAGTGNGANREKFRTDLVAAINQRIRQLADQGTDLGVRIARVDLSPSIPRGAKGAFDYVLVAAQRAEETAAYARTNAELMAQQTNQTIDQIAIHAETEAQEKVISATERTAAIASLARENANVAPLVLNRRLYYERIKEILKKAERIDTVDSDAAAKMILPGGAER